MYLLHNIIIYHVVKWKKKVLKDLKETSEGEISDKICELLNLNLKFSKKDASTTYTVSFVIVDKKLSKINRRPQ